VKRSRSQHPQTRRARTAAAGVLLAVALAPAAPASARAAERPTAEMLAPVQALVAFMARLPEDEHATMFAPRGVTIIENYPPFIFAGADAVERWEAGFRRHAADGSLTELALEFGPAQDFRVSGRRAYFSLPTTWVGKSAGRPFEERGAWSFVIVRTTAGWKIQAYGWGVISLVARAG
jgi:hypothetical protein